MLKIILIAAGAVIVVLAVGYIASVIACAKMRYDDQLLD